MGVGVGFGWPHSRNLLTLESIQGFILLMVQTVGPKALRSGALAKAVGVSADTIRHYERLGILPPALRTASGYRAYPASAIERVLVVRRALGIGFSLPELAEVLKAHDVGGAPCRRVYELAQEKLERISNDIRVFATNGGLSQEDLGRLGKTSTHGEARTEITFAIQPEQRSSDPRAFKSARRRKDK